MSADLTLPVREAVVAFLRADGPFTALQPAARVFGQLQPPNTPMPFTRCGQPSGIPLEFSCFNGCTITMDLGSWADNEGEVCAIASELVTALDGKDIPLKDADNNVIGGMTARLTGFVTGKDPEEESVWRAIRTFDFEASL